MVRFINPQKPKNSRALQGLRAQAAADRRDRSAGIPSSAPQFITPQKPKAGRAFMAAKAQAARGRALWSQDRIAKIGANYGIARARPDQRKAGGFEIHNSSGGYGRLTITGYFSDQSKLETRIVPNVSSDLLERWWYIDHGQLPRPDYDSYLPLTDEEVREEYAQQANTVLANTKAQMDDLRTDARAQTERLIEMIDEINERIRNSGDPYEIEELESERRSRQAAKRAIDEEWKANEDRLRESYHEKREEIWSELADDQRKKMERMEEILEDLKAGIYGEIQQEADRYFQGSGLFVLEEWILE